MRRGMAPRFWTCWRWRTAIIALLPHIDICFAAYYNVRGEGTRSVTDRREKTRSTRRLFIFAGILGLAAVALLVQLVRLTILLPAREGADTLVMPQVERGAILDRQGKSSPSRRASAGLRLGARLDERPGERRAACPDAGHGPGGPAGQLEPPRWIRRGRSARSPPEEAQAITALKAQGKLAGVRVEDDFGRFYPQGRLASHVVGYVGADNVPWDGDRIHLQRRPGAAAGGDGLRHGVRQPGLPHHRRGNRVPGGKSRAGRL